MLDEYYSKIKKTSMLGASFTGYKEAVLAAAVADQAYRYASYLSTRLVAGVKAPPRNQASRKINDEEGRPAASDHRQEAMFLPGA